MLESLPFRHIIGVDTEFNFGGREGNRPRPVALVAKELRTGQTWRLWRGEFPSRPPFPVGPDSLIVAFYSSAEFGVFRQLGWGMPQRVLDLFCEFRALTNGRRAPGEKDSLIGLLTYFSIDVIDALDKQEMIDLILADGPELESRREEALDYCQGDVEALSRVLPAMLPRIDLPRALLRGRYMANGASAMEHHGIPIDAPLWERLVARWDDIKRDLIDAVDADYHVYEDGVFKQVLFDKLLTRLNIPWARLESGHLDLSDDTFRAMAKSYPIISPLRELRHTLSELRLNKLTIGDDGCNRTILSAFRARTGRNQPSSAKFIFGPSVWIRGLIKPKPGMGVAYIDWSSQEIGIAASLSGDPNLLQAYADGDVYLAFGKQCGRLPANATKESHGAERELLKQCCLGINYAMGERSLALRLGQPEIVARNLLRDHHNTYPRFWRWSDSAVDLAMQGRTLWTTYGWPIRIGPNPNPRSLRNFPMQGHAAECLRIACCLGTERGVTIAGPVHDAFLISAPLDRLDHDIAIMRGAMAEASRAVLGGFELRTDVDVTRYPGRFMDEKRGRKMWDHVMRLLAQAEDAQGLTRAVG